MNDVQNDAALRDAQPSAAVRDINGAPLVRLDRRFLGFSIVATLLLCWPLLVFGHPSYIQDSVAYHKGGRAAVDYVLKSLNRPEVSTTANRSTQASPSTPAATEITGNEVKGARSVTYSIAAYLLSGPGATMLLLALAQAAAAATVIVAILGAFGGLPTRRTIASLIVLAGATTVAPVCFLVIPDIFAGLIIACTILLTVAQSRLSLGVRLLCAAIATFAVTAHNSLIPIAGGMAGLGLGWVAIRHFTNDPLPRWTWAWVVGPLIVGAFTLLTINRVAFGETSLAAKRYPFALSRSINNGPGRWYLEKHCHELAYTICTVYPHGLPKGGALEFLWGPDGVTKRATPAQMDRIRAEEPAIVLAAGREYADFEMRMLAYKFTQQLIRFRPYSFDARMALDSGGTAQLAPEPHDTDRILILIYIVAAISTLLSCVWLAWAFVKRRLLRPIIVLLFLGILGNAATCVLFAAMAERYQARVIWLIPLFALALSGAVGGSGRDTRPRVA
ncbi:MAG: hypothetical protein JO335_06020 [Sphingomonas sp.]|nr:hypothetical protein [Sphingomonas sp.]